MAESFFCSLKQRTDQKENLQKCAISPTPISSITLSSSTSVNADIAILGGKSPETFEAASQRRALGVPVKSWEVQTGPITIVLHESPDCDSSHAQRRKRTNGSSRSYTGCANNNLIPVSMLINSLTERRTCNICLASDLDRSQCNATRCIRA